MTTEKKTSDQIREWVHAKIHQLEGVRGSQAKIDVPPPQAHSPDKDGANWNMGNFPGAHGYANDVRAIVEDARRRFVLLEPE